MRINPTTKSKRINWDDIYASDPDVVIVACCGFDLKRNVQDVNDCAPEFSKESYNVQVPESLPQGSLVAKVEARDQDTGVNQEIEFSLRPDFGNFSDLFKIDPETGEIRLERSLDHARLALHHLTVVATDKGPRLGPADQADGDPRPGHGIAHVWISVLDTNDNVVMPSDHDYGSMVPLTHDKRSKASLIKVIVS